ncbi:MAG: M20 family metallo-hydrolase [Bacteroidales bacterium]
MNGIICKDELFYEAIELLCSMISKPSISGDEYEVSKIIEECLRADGIECNREMNNIWAYANEYDPAMKTVLLNSHIDTIKPVKGWSYDPFSPTEVGDSIYGLGSNDAGASVVSLIAAFKYLRSKELSFNLIISATAEEENSGGNGVEALLRKLPNIDLAIVGEPTQMHAAIAEKGLLVVDCCVVGKSGHAARDEGVNAIYLALPLIEKVKNFRFSRVSEFLGEVKCSVTMMQAGTQHNVVPDSCNFTIDIRTNELYSNQEALDIISEALGCEVKARSLRLNSSQIETSHPIVQRAKTLGMRLYGSPTLSDQSRMNFPSVKIGPGDSARSHTADEFISKSEIREGIEIYIKLLEGLKLD